MNWEGVENEPHLASSAFFSLFEGRCVLLLYDLMVVPAWENVHLLAPFPQAELQHTTRTIAEACAIEEAEGGFSDGLTLAPQCACPLEWGR